MRIRAKTLPLSVAFFFVLASGVSAAAQQERWEELNARVEELYKQGKYAEALPLAEEALRLAEATFSPDHPHVATALNYVAEVLWASGKYAEAEPLHRRALEIREKAFGPEHPAVADSLHNLAELCRARGRFAEAEPLHQRALAIREKLLGPHHPDVVVSLHNLAKVYYDQGNFVAAEPLFLRAQATAEEHLPPGQPIVATVLSNLGLLYGDQGRYAAAEPLLQRALALREQTLGAEHSLVSDPLENLAGVYRAQGKYAQAEPLYRRALMIREKALGPDHPNVGASLNNLASLYDDQGKYAEAELHYQRALGIAQKALGAEHPIVGIALNNLALLYHEQGKYAEAEPLVLRALAIAEKARGPAHPFVATVSNNLAQLYSAQGKYDEAAPLYQRALSVVEKAFGPQHPYRGFTLHNLATLYRVQGKFEEAEPLFAAALDTLEKTLGSEHPRTGKAEFSFATLRYAQQLPDQAEPLFAHSLQNLAKQFEQHFTYMSEKERLGFLDTVSSNFPVYYSFCLHYRQRSPSLVGKMYDVVLWQKGFIAQSMAALRGLVAAGGDPEALARLEELSAKRTQLAKLLSAPARDREQWRKNVAQLEQEANELERELVKRSAALAEEKRLARVSWRDVQKALKPGEAAVEFLRFRYHDGRQWTDKSYYLALVLTPETTAAPLLVVLGDAQDLEGAPLQEYRLLVSPEGGSGQRAAEVLWKPLEAALGKAKRVYLAPDGLLNLLAWNSLPLDQRRRLLDAYDLRVLSSTRDLLRERRPAASQTAVLVGHPQFNLEEEQQRAAALSMQKAEEEKMLVALVRGSRSRDQQGQTLPSLPGAKIELDAVETLLEKRGWQVERFSGATALEEAVKQVRQPRLLHLATHGFFLADQEAVARERSAEAPSGREDPMLRSGLYLAGAERALAGQPLPADLDDGILTAYEASGLNLQGTELVVLSACETGLGEVKNGEGVFGLRRALQVAGAEAVLMSLWEVPDRETQELMTLFYEKWLGGQSKPEALRKAQQELRGGVKKRYGADLPYYWGAFVLVGR